MQLKLPATPIEPNRRCDSPLYRKDVRGARALGQTPRLEPPAYILEMARLEADQIAKGSRMAASWCDRAPRRPFGSSRRGDADACEQRTARIAVGDHPEPRLHFADIVAQLEIDMAVEIVHLVAQCRKSRWKAMRSSRDG